MSRLSNIYLNNIDLGPPASLAKSNLQLPLQGVHDWYQTLNKMYSDLGYSTSQADPCVHFKKENGNYTITDTYTDDIFGASNNDVEARWRKEELGKIWGIKDVGENK